MSKGERISQFVRELEGSDGNQGATRWRIIPIMWVFPVLERAALLRSARRARTSLVGKDDADDAQYFKGLIQAAGAFVHLQKQFEHPTHPKHGRRLGPAVRLFRLAEKNLLPYGPTRHRFDLAGFRQLLRRQVDAILASDHRENPWTPESAPKIALEL